MHRYRTSVECDSLEQGFPDGREGKASCWRHYRHPWLTLVSRTMMGFCASVLDSNVVYLTFSNTQGVVVLWCIIYCRSTTAHYWPQLFFKALSYSLSSWVSLGLVYCFAVIVRPKYHSYSSGRVIWPLVIEWCVLLSIGWFVWTSYCLRFTAQNWNVTIYLCRNRIRWDLLPQDYAKYPWEEVKIIHVVLSSYYTHNSRLVELFRKNLPSIFRWVCVEFDYKKPQDLGK